RGAAEFVRTLGPDVPVFLYSGLVESENLDWEKSTEREKYITAPFQAYSVPNTILPVPLDWMAERAKRYEAAEIDPVVQSAKKIALVAFDEMKLNGVNSGIVLKGELEKRGFKVTGDRRFGLVDAMVLEKAIPPNPRAASFNTKSGS